MKLTVGKSELISALKKVSNVNSTRSPIPVVSNIHFTAEDNKIILRTTDLELSVRTEIDASVEVSGCTTIPCKKLNEIVNKLPNGDISIEVTDHQAHIKAGKSFFRIVGMDPKEFPIEDAPVETRSFTRPVNELSRNLKKIAYSASTDDSRYVLNGILFSIRSGQFCMVATDGRRLAMMEQTIDGDSSLDCDAVLPMKAVNELIKSLDADGEVTINLTDNQASFTTDNTLIVTKLVDGNYPNFRNVIPSSFDYSAVVNRGAFTEALERVSLMVSESCLSVQVTFDTTAVTLHTSSAELGESTEELTMDFNGEKMEVAFNPKFLADPLKQLDCDNLIFKINSVSNPIALTGDEGFTYIIMPMRN